MDSLFDLNFYIEQAEKGVEFWSFSQNWFDILSLILTLLSLWIAFYLGERGYKRDQRDKNKDQEQLVNSEIKLFKNNLKELLNAADSQLDGLKKYEVDESFSLVLNPSVQVDFLKYIDVKNVYEYFGYKDSSKLDVVNSLFSSLFSLNDFRESLRDSVRNYITRYTDFEKGFYLYRKLMYRMMHDIANKNAIELINVEDGVHINFGGNDFAERFFHLTQAVLQNPELFNENGDVIRPKLMELFIMPAIDLSKYYIPIDEDAIQVSDVANEVRSSWLNIEVVTTAHFNEITGHIKILANVKKNINEFLELQKQK